MDPGMGKVSFGGPATGAATWRHVFWRCLEVNQSEVGGLNGQTSTHHCKDLEANCVQLPIS